MLCSFIPKYFSFSREHNCNTTIKTFTYYTSLFSNFASCPSNGFLWHFFPQPRFQSRITYFRGVPKLWHLMPDGLRWSWYNNNRNKVHNKCSALESSRNHPPPLPPTPSLWKSCLPRNWSLVPKRLGTADILHLVRYLLSLF